MIADIRGTFTTFRNFIGCRLRGGAKSAVLLFAATIVLASCGSSSSGGGSSPAPTASLTASPSTITSGESTNLTFSSTNATSGTITNNPGPNVGPVGIASQGNGVPVSPTANTTYTYTVTGPGGSATASAAVTVNPAPPTPTMTSFSVSPATILPGAPITLSWASQNADYVVINANVGASPGRVAASGTNFSVPTPTQTTIYSAVATTNSGQQSSAAMATLTVNPITSFQGMYASQVPGGTGVTEDDIDPNGAVGTKQFMEYVNTAYQGYDKTTFAPVWTNADGSSHPLSIGTPWVGLQHCADPKIQLDAVINFDRLANRWLIAAKTTVAKEYYFCLAVSNTDDLASPTFAWYPYYLKLDSYLNSGTYLPDWPKLGTWWNGYYAAMDTINVTVVNGVSQQTEVGVVACGFDRATMLTGAGTPNAPGACLEVSGPLSQGVYLAHSLIPADVDGTTAPPTGRDEYMVSIQNPPLDGVSTTSPTINLWDFQFDPTALTLTLVAGAPTSLTVDSYWPGCYTTTNPAQTTCVQEPGVVGLGGLEVDSVGDRFMPRFAYRNFGTYESFLVSHTVQTGAGAGTGQMGQQTGIRWYELLGNGTGTPTLNQQATISPDGTTFRFLPSIAQDKMGNVAAGYSVSSPQMNPGIDFSYWNLNDPGGPVSTPVEITILNGANEGEEVPYLFTAIPPVISNLGQWGSYASITVDPTDDCTFWYVNEYWPTPTNTAGTPATWSTNIANFQIPGCH
jgi:hypothetical protein